MFEGWPNILRPAAKSKHPGRKPTFQAYQVESCRNVRQGTVDLQIDASCIFDLQIDGWSLHDLKVVLLAQPKGRATVNTRHAHHAHHDK
ncbi:MAG: hypothetical protein CMN32_09465 [Saprospirales bacterium]|nr:hypothetical protein [Saprospirales bacterium]